MGYGDGICPRPYGPHLHHGRSTAAPFNIQFRAISNASKRPPVCGHHGGGLGQRTAVPTVVG